MLWPKFDSIFKTYIESIFKVNIKNTKLLVNGIHTVTYKLGEFLGMINLICKHTTTQMLTTRILLIQFQFNKFFSEISENFKFSTNYEREEMVAIFFINNLYYLLKQINDLENLIADDNPTSFEATYNNKKESYIHILINKNLEDLERIYNLTKPKAEMQHGDTKDKKDNKINYNNDNNDKSIISSNLKKGEVNEINFSKEQLNKIFTRKELEKTAFHFNSKYKDIFDHAKKDIFESVKDKINAKMIYIQFLEKLTEM